MNENVTLYKIRKIVQARQIKWVSHIIDRMTQRNISTDEVIECIMNGKIIEEYPTDYPYPSCLILAYINNKKYIHVVCAFDEDTVYMITTYYPNTIDWLEDFETRRNR